MTPLLAMFSAAAAATATPGAAPPDTPPTLANARVVRVSARPQISSGIIVVWADFDVRTRAGELRRLHMIYFGEDQYLPAVGATCDIWYERSLLRDFVDDGRFAADVVGDSVRRLRCDTGKAGS